MFQVKPSSTTTSLKTQCLEKELPEVLADELVRFTTRVPQVGETREWAADFLRKVINAAPSSEVSARNNQTMFNELIPVVPSHLRQSVKSFDIKRSSLLPYPDDYLTISAKGFDGKDLITWKIDVPVWVNEKGCVEEKKFYLRLITQ